MINNPEELEQTRLLVCNLKAAIGAIRSRYQDDRHVMCDLLTEGPLMQIEKLQEEIDDYLDRIGR